MRSNYLLAGLCLQLLTWGVAAQCPSWSEGFESYPPGPLSPNGGWQIGVIGSGTQGGNVAVGGLQGNPAAFDGFQMVRIAAGEDAVLP